MRTFFAALAVGVALRVGLAFDDSCPARVDRVGSASLEWIHPAGAVSIELDSWCRAVGPPLYRPAPPVDTSSPPALQDLAIVTWNAHVGNGRLPDLLRALRNGELTGGRAIDHFVVLTQEVYRRGPEVPRFGADAHGPRAITAPHADSSDVSDAASLLGLSILYVPAMRNGTASPEDRGNAILSTEPLARAFALELPFERQRRVAVGAAIDVMADGKQSTLRVLTTHLETLSSPRSLWVFGDPRARQASALVDLFVRSRFEDDVGWAATVIGGDFNAVKHGADERALRVMRAWAADMATDQRKTHLMGRLDYLFYRALPGWRADARRGEEKFGSDHYPVIGRFESAQ